MKIDYTAGTGLFLFTSEHGCWVVAYLREAHPKLATLFAAMTHDLQYRDGDKPKYSSLEDFERLYFKVGTANSGWYQSAFFGRVEQVYSTWPSGRGAMAT